uniref:CWH43-like N-terminal domain-containing protein n=1 Tax=Peronospora matthiolae TaxID=2874970 RepID=A0AAV1VCT4_9STRA
MSRRDNVGFIAWLVPLIGISTMLSTEFMACTSHFNCFEAFPTLSYAATFRPEGYIFMLGMSLTAVLIFVSISLFFWYLRLRTRQQRHNSSGKSSTQYVAVGYTCLVFGLVTALSLFGLAAMDMQAYHDAHIVFTVVFFGSRHGHDDCGASAGLFA